MIAIYDVFVAASGSGVWQLWLIAILGVLYFLSGIIQLLGIKWRLASLLGSLIPFGVIVLIILAVAGVWADGALATGFFAAVPYGTSFTFPFTFEYAFMPWGLGFGFYLVGLGSLLSFVATFLSRESY
jgi:hypothetical protein